MSVSPRCPAVGRRSREIVEDELPEITWEHSHVVVDDEGKVRTFCVYARRTKRWSASTRAASASIGIDSIEEIVGDVTPADFPAV